MALFLLLLTPEHREAKVLSAAELGRRTSDFVDWLDVRRRSGVIREGARLEPCARRIQREREGARELGEGAPIGLYFLVELPDWDAAVELASGCPAVRPGTIDVFALDHEAWLPIAREAAPA